jgi:nitrogen fixation NifU-like protein
METRDLYQDIILDHGRKPRNFHKMDHPSHFANGHNPLCGDRVTVFLEIEGDKIKDVSFDGRGCAISTASASLMTEVLKGKTLAEAQELFKAFHAEVTGGQVPAVEETLQDDFERLAPFEGVKAYPTRVKCATLAWHAFEAALKDGAVGATVKTE